MSAVPIDWPNIDTVLLDMDGTLLDLDFDNRFWQEVIPQRYAAVQGLSLAEARARLEPQFRAARGTLEWYCLDHWSQQLGLPIGDIKRGSLEGIRYLPGAESFLRGVRALGKRVVLVTNAHPLTLALKDSRARLTVHFDACYSTHAFAMPKERAEFWPQLHAVERFTAARTLFVDDSVPVLDAALGFGIRWLRAIRYPDSGRGAQTTGRHVAVDRVADLLEGDGKGLPR